MLGFTAKMHVKLGEQECSEPTPTVKELGADVNHQDDKGCTALYAAAVQAGDLEMVRCLFELVLKSIKQQKIAARP
jgi:hypothetical protein